ncbi:conserved hypothetical protein, partial [Mycobacterium tuberculosis T46]
KLAVLVVCAIPPGEPSGWRVRPSTAVAPAGCSCR